MHGSVRVDPGVERASPFALHEGETQALVASMLGHNDMVGAWLSGSLSPRHRALRGMGTPPTAHTHTHAETQTPTMAVFPGGDLLPGPSGGASEEGLEGIGVHREDVADVDVAEDAVNYVQHGEGEGVVYVEEEEQQEQEEEEQRAHRRVGFGAEELHVQGKGEPLAATPWTRRGAAAGVQRPLPSRTSARLGGGGAGGAEPRDMSADDLKRALARARQRSSGAHHGPARSRSRGASRSPRVGDGSPEVHGQAHGQSLGRTSPIAPGASAGAGAGAGAAHSGRGGGGLVGSTRVQSIHRHRERHSGGGGAAYASFGTPPATPAAALARARARSRSRGSSVLHTSPRLLDHYRAHVHPHDPDYSRDHPRHASPVPQQVRGDLGRARARSGRPSGSQHQPGRGHGWVGEDTGVRGGVGLGRLDSALLEPALLQAIKGPIVQAAVAYDQYSRDLRSHRVADRFPVDGGGQARSPELPRSVGHEGLLDGRGRQPLPAPSPIASPGASLPSRSRHVVSVSRNSSLKVRVRSCCGRRGGYGSAGERM